MKNLKKFLRWMKSLLNYLIDNYTVDSLQNCLQKDISIQGVGKISCRVAILKATL